jgi:hypothetical protein
MTTVGTTIMNTKELRNVTVRAMGLTEGSEGVKGGAGVAITFAPSDCNEPQINDEYHGSR